MCSLGSLAIPLNSLEVRCDDLVDHGEYCGTDNDKASAWAEVSIPPEKDCQLLAHLLGMRTGPYQHKEGLSWTCLTPYYVLGPSSSDAPHNPATTCMGRLSTSES
jgi:hypothetical protein